MPGGYTDSYTFIIDNLDFEDDRDFVRSLKKCNENCLKDCRDVKKTLVVEQGTNGTHISAVAVSNNEMDNRIISVPCETSHPLNAEVYDTIRDVYVVEGVSYLEIGFIPCNYRLRMDSASWEMDVPVPPSVIRRYLTVDQKKRLDKWKSRWNRKDYVIEYLQSLRVY